MPAITFSATFTDEQIDAFAVGNGYQAMLGDEDPTPNPIPAVDFAIPLVRQNMVDYIILPQLHAIVATKQQEQAEAIAALKASVGAAITVEVN